MRWKVLSWFEKAASMSEDERNISDVGKEVTRARYEYGKRLGRAKLTEDRSLRDPRPQLLAAISGAHCRWKRVGHEWDQAS